MSLECEGLAISVPGRTICRDVSFAVAPGEVWAVLGANGSGKTTLLHTIAGLKPSAAGQILWKGSPLAARSSRERAREVGLLMQQEDSTFWGTALEYVRLGRFPHMRSWFAWQREDDEHAAKALDAVGLAPLAGRAYASLSGGERQRVRIAQLIGQAPRLLLLDEPLQHLDLRHQALALTLFRRLALEEERAVVMVLHDALWPGRTCSHALLILDTGAALAGTARDVLTRQNLERLYGCALQEFAQNGDRYFVPHV